MTSNLSMPKLVIPTGFESRNRQLESQRALAQALRERALAGTPTNATSWTQVLAPVVQGLVSGHLQKRADKDQQQFDTDLRGAMDQTSSELQADLAQLQSGAMPLEALVAKYQNNPLAQQMIEPYVKGLGTLITNRQSWKPEQIASPSGAPQDVLINQAGEVKASPYHVPKNEFHNDIAVDMNSVQTGQAAPPNLNATVLPDGAGGAQLNIPKILANVASQGLRIDDPAALVAALRSYGQPGMGQPQPPSAPPSAQQSGELPVLTDDPASVAAYSAAMQQRLPPAYRPPNGYLNGKPAWFIKGEWYDNPEGRE